MGIVVSVVLALLAAISNAVASVLQRLANVQEADTGSGGVRSLLHLLRNPIWLGGFAAVLASFGLQAGALDHGEVSLVQPLLLLELPITLVLASRVLGRSLPRGDWPAIAAMTAGVALLLFCLSPRGGKPVEVDGEAWSAGAVAVCVVLFLLLIAAARAAATGRAALLGVASGVSFAATAVLMAAALAHGLDHLFQQWQTYCMALAGLTAMVLLQEALRAGPLLVVQPGVTLSDPAVAILLGVALFGEQARAGPWLIGEVAGAAGVAWGTWRLSRSPVLDAEPDATRGAAAPAPTGG